MCGIGLRWRLAERMATRRRPLPYAAEAIRLDAVAQLNTLREMLKQVSTAAAQGNTALVVRVGVESLDKTRDVIDILNEIPRLRE